MAIIRFKDLKNMNVRDRKEKLKELQLELIKTRAVKKKENKTKEIKKTIARILMLN